MAEQKVVLVTGANRGLGFEVCRQLAARAWRVFLTARHPEAGLEALAPLKQAGGHVSFLALDVTRPESIEAAARHLGTEVDHLDVLVNNAGVLEDGDGVALKVGAEVVRRTFDINTLGPLLVSQRMFPLLARSPAARIINLSSGLGSLEHMGQGYPAYRISKAALNAVTRVLAAELAPRRIAVNSASPGWVRTDMGGPTAPSSVEEGADTVVWLATEAPQELTGQFVSSRKPIPW